MIWFFERPGEHLRCEIRRSVLGSGYELVWTAGDGRTHDEHSHNPEELMNRRRALEHWLKLDGWIRPGRITPPRRTRPQSQWQTRKFERPLGSDIH
jgi:hypothetical protein